MATVSALLVPNAFPKLQGLELEGSSDIKNEGVELLVQGLLASACQTRLTNLDLRDVGMGDIGMVALSSLVCTGRFSDLKN